MPRFEIRIYTGFPRATHTCEGSINDEDWAEMNEREREEALDDLGRDALRNYISVSVEEIKD